MEKTSKHSLARVINITLIIVGFIYIALFAFNLLSTQPVKFNLERFKATIFSQLGLIDPTLDFVENLCVPALYICFGILYILFRKRGFAILVVGFANLSTIIANTVYMQKIIPHHSWNLLALVFPAIVVTCGCLLLIDQKRNHD